MSLIKKMETAQNEFLNPVFIALATAGGTALAKEQRESALLRLSLKLNSEQRESALLVAGMMAAIRTLVTQAGEIILTMELDDLA